MFHEEAVIDGILCHRSTPDGEWRPYTVEQLTAKLLEARKQLENIESELDNLYRQNIYNQD